MTTTTTAAPASAIERRDGLPLLGFIGLGKMGAAMARNLVTAGYTVKVYNRTAAATAPLVALGAHAVAQPRELADVDVLFTMTNDAAALQACVIESGLLAAMQAHHHARQQEQQSQAANDHAVPSSSQPQRRRQYHRDPRSASSSAAPPSLAVPLRQAVHVSCATLPAGFARTQAALHAEHDVTYVSMPVLGRPDAAAAAKLHLLFSGDAEALAALRPILVPTLGQSLRYYGGKAESAVVMKIAFNMMLACAIEAIGEGCALVQKYDLHARDFVALLADTLFDCTAYRGYGSLVAGRHFVPAGASLTGVGLKDCSLALEAGAQAAVPLPFASILRDHYLEAIAQGMGEWDWSAIAVVAERHAGLPQHTAPQTQEQEQHKAEEEKEEEKGAEVAAHAASDKKEEKKEEEDVTQQAK